MEPRGSYAERGSLPGINDGEVAAFLQPSGEIMICTWSGSEWKDVGRLASKPHGGGGDDDSADASPAATGDDSAAGGAVPPPPGDEGTPLLRSASTIGAVTRSTPLGLYRSTSTAGAIGAPPAPLMMGRSVSETWTSRPRKLDARRGGNRPPVKGAAGRAATSSASAADALEAGAGNEAPVARLVDMHGESEVVEAPATKNRVATVTKGLAPQPSEAAWGPEHQRVAELVSDGVSFTDGGAHFPSEAPLHFEARAEAGSAVSQVVSVKQSPGGGYTLWVRLREPVRAAWSSRWSLSVLVQRAGSDAEWVPAGTITGDTQALEILVPVAEGGSPGASVDVQLTVILDVVEALVDGGPLITNFTHDGQWAQQSSVEEDDEDHWMYPTKLEWQPFWEMAVDMGGKMFIISRMRFRDTRTKLLHLYGLPAPTLRYRIYVDEKEVHQVSVPADKRSEPIDVEVNEIGLYVRIEVMDAFAVLELDSADIYCTSTFGDTLQSTWRATFAAFHDKPLFGERNDRRLTAGGAGGAGGSVSSLEPLPASEVGWTWSTYSDVKKRIDCFMEGLDKVVDDTDGDLTGADGQVFVTICGRNSEDWMVTDIVCALGGHVSVPLPFTCDAEVGSFIVAQTECSVMVCSQAPSSVLLGAIADGTMPTIKLFISMDGEVPTTAAAEKVAAAGVKIMHIRDVEAIGQRVLDEAAASGRSLARKDPDPEALCSLVYTSGSTGMPKGAMRSYDAFNEAYQEMGLLSNSVHVSFAPLSHLAEREVLPCAVMLSGGQAAFVDPGPTFYEDIRFIQPTFLNAVPRFFNRLYSQFVADLQQAKDASNGRSDADVYAAVMASYKGILGNRLASVAIGSAPVTPAVFEWMKEVFKPAAVIEAYGTTECGTVTVQNVVPPDVDFKLVDVPELGYYATDDPPRGEVWVKTKTMIGGYFKNEEKTKAAFVDGYFRTGDVAEQETLPDGRIQLRLIGRSKNVLKLAGGEFVEPELIETKLLRNPLLDQIHIHADGTKTSVVALVVTEETVLRRLAVDRGLAFDDTPMSELCSLPRVKALVVQEIKTEAKAAGLVNHQIPAAVALHPERFTPENGFMTSSNKPNRPGIEKHFKEVFAKLYEESETMESQLAAAFHDIGQSMGTDGKLPELDSLSGSRVAAVFQQRTGLSVPVSAFVGADAGASFEELKTRVELKLAGGGSTKEATDLDLAADAYLPAVRTAAELDAPAGSPAAVVLAGLPVTIPATDVFLTGATGFLGIFLLDELLRKTSARIHCLARVKGDADAPRKAQDRIRDARLRAGLTWDAECDARVVGVAGDLSLPSFGLSDEDFARLAQTCDLIVHNGSIVNWVFDYATMRAANVLGTLEIIRLATTARLKPLAHVSTVSTGPDGGSERDTVDIEEYVRYGGGYVLTKLVAETHVERAARAGLPVVILRPGMITGHSSNGFSNTEQFVDRYLMGCVGLGAYVDDASTTDLSPVDWVSAAAVHFATHAQYYSHARDDDRLHVFLLTLVKRAITYKAIGAAISSYGYSCTPTDYTTFRERLVASPENKLAPLLSFFPESGFALGGGSNENDATLRLLDEAGLVAPAIGDTLVHTYLASLVRRHQLNKPEPLAAGGVPDATLLLLRRATSFAEPTERRASTSKQLPERLSPMASATRAATGGAGRGRRRGPRTKASGALSKKGRRASPAKDSVRAGAAATSVSNFAGWMGREGSEAKSFPQLNEQLFVWMKATLAAQPGADLREGVAEYADLAAAMSRN